MLVLRSFPLYPLLLVLAGIVTLFVNAGEPVTVLPRPIILACVGVLFVQGVLSMALRNRELGALAAVMVVLVVTRLWPLAAALAVLPAWWWLISAWRKRRGATGLSPRILELGRRLLGTFSAALLAVVIVGGILNGAFSWYAAPSREPANDRAANLPNIYMVMLDGYPGIDSVKALGFDNASFVAGLKNLGFDVADAPRSNYTQTWPTLASMFQMAYLEQVPGLLPSPMDLGEQRRRLLRAINTGPALQALRAAGYWVETTPSPFSSTNLESADHVADPGYLNEFEELLLRNSGILSLLGDAGESWVASQQRGWINANVDSIALAADDRPTLSFIHIMAPHPPFLFKADGSPAPLRDCYPTSCPFWVTELGGTETTVAEYGDALRAELAYLNSRVLQRLGTLTSRDPSAVVVLFSDHGLRFNSTGSAEYFQSFFAARTPGKDGVFSGTISPVNMFPSLLNAYLGTKYTMAPYKAWISGVVPLELTPLTGTEAP